MVVAQPRSNGTVTFESQGADERVILRQSGGARRVDIVNNASGTDAGSFMIQENFDPRGFFLNTYSCLWKRNEGQTVEVHCDAGVYSSEDPAVRMLTLLEGRVVDEAESAVIGGREASCYMLAARLALQAASGIACIGVESQLPVRVAGSGVGLDASHVTNEVADNIVPEFSRVSGLPPYSSYEEDIAALLLPSQVR
jgi:hypothetical protein